MFIGYDQSRTSYTVLYVPTFWLKLQSAGFADN